MKRINIIDANIEIVNMDAIIKVTALHANFLVLILLHLQEKPLMKESVLCFNCIVQAVNAKIHGKAMFLYAVKDVLKPITKIAVPTVVN